MAHGPPRGYIATYIVKPALRFIVNFGIKYKKLLTRSKESKPIW